MTAHRRTTDLGEVVYGAPHRSARPRPAGADDCPFCPGREDQTPPTLRQVPSEGPWSARAFANRWPLTARHEVLVDTARHVTTFADLDAEEARRALLLSRDRAAAAANTGWPYLLFRNEGPEAGGSVPHAHAQLVADPAGFPRLARAPSTERPAVQEVASSDGFELVVPDVARWPHEAWVRPAGPSAAFEALDDAAIGPLAVRLLDASRRARRVTGGRGWNIVLNGAVRPWRFEVLPRTERLAGLELGGGVWVNPVSSGDSVAAWRRPVPKT